MAGKGGCQKQIIETPGKSGFKWGESSPEGGIGDVSPLPVAGLQTGLHAVMDCTSS